MAYTSTTETYFISKETILLYTLSSTQTAYKFSILYFLPTSVVLQFVLAKFSSSQSEYCLFCLLVADILLSLFVVQYSDLFHDSEDS